jgi:DNA replication protein DnaC
MVTLITCDWIRSHHNLHLTGPTGTGKSWLACALGQQACRQGLSVRYERVARLLDALRIARGDGSYHKRLSALAKTDLLILDDFGLKPLTQAERLDLLELIDDLGPTEGGAGFEFSFRVVILKTRLGEPLAQCYASP